MENYQLESFNALVSRVVDEVIPTLDPTVVDEEVTANQEEYSDAEKAKIPENPVSPQSTNHENYDAVDNELANESNPASPVGSPESPTSNNIPDTVSQTQHSIQDETQGFQTTAGSFNMSMNTQQSSIATQAEESFNETFTNIPERPVIHPRKDTDQPKSSVILNDTQNNTQIDASDSFYDDLSGIEDGGTKNSEDEFKEFLDQDDPLEAFCKAKGINYTKCTPREYYKGFREDDQFRTEAEQQKASKDLLEYKDGDPIWKIKEVDGYIYMQLDKPGYACNPQEFIENKIFSENVTDSLVDLGKIKQGEIMTENTEEEREAAQEKIIKRIKQQFDYQKRNMNDRFNNLATLEEFKNQVAQKYEIDFTDD